MLFRAKAHFLQDHIKSPGVVDARNPRCRRRWGRRGWNGFASVQVHPFRFCLRVSGGRFLHRLSGLLRRVPQGNHLSGDVFLAPLGFFHSLPHKGDRLRAENGEPALHIHIQHADSAGLEVHAVNLHAPPINGQLHAQRDIVRCVPLLNDFIGGIRAPFRVRLCQYHAVTMFQQLFKRCLPCAGASGHGGFTQAGNLPHQHFRPQGGGRFLGVPAVEKHIASHLDAHQLIRVPRF